MKTSKKSDAAKPGIASLLGVLKFSKKVVITLLVSVAIFTMTMIVVFVATGSVPDTLIAEFFGFFKAEGGILGIIKAVETIAEIFSGLFNKKEKKQDEQSELEAETFEP